MKKQILIGGVISIILVSALLIIVFQGQDVINLDEKNRLIIAKLESILPDGWEIVEYEQNTVPHGYNGSSDCFYVNIENTDLIVDKVGKYIHSGNYAFYYLWFAPLEWNGTYATGEPIYYQDWAPRHNETKNYNIFWATDGDPSNTIDVIILDYS